MGDIGKEKRIIEIPVDPSEIPRKLPAAPEPMKEPSPMPVREPEKVPASAGGAS